MSAERFSLAEWDEAEDGVVTHFHVMRGEHVFFEVAARAEGVGRDRQRKELSRAVLCLGWHDRLVEQLGTLARTAEEAWGKDRYDVEMSVGMLEDIKREAAK